MALVIALTVFVGFAPTYYLRLAGEGPMTTITGAPITPLAHLHGLLFTSWVLLFLTQASLVAAGSVRVHRRLGVAGAALAAAMVLVGTRTAIASAARGNAPPGADPLAFLAIPLFDMVVFAPLVVTAIALRRRREAHKRLMLLATLSLMSAPIARWPGVLPLGPLVFFGLTDLLLVPGIVFDLATRRRIHPAYVWGGLALVASQALRLVVSGTSTWLAIARWLTG